MGPLSNLTGGSQLPPFEPLFLAPPLRFPQSCLDPNVQPATANQPAPPGSLIVLDGSFACDTFDEGHGSAVTRAAREAGYRGNIRQISDLARSDTSAIDRPGLTGEEARRAFQDYARQQVTGLLDRHSGTLNALAGSGTRNSALNISAGTSQSDLLRQFMQSIGQHPERERNAERAFGFSAERLRSGDPRVSQQEEQRLAQAIVDSNRQALDGNADVEAARQRYATAVRRFESGNNSVVVSTTNPNPTDTIAGLRLPPDFHRSYNINDQVTPIGSRPTDRDPASPRDADQTIYSRGEVWHTFGPPFQRPPWERPQQGTSYAAPRAAALVAELHRRNPQLSSAQVETLMRNQFTIQREGRTELDDNAAGAMLRGEVR